MADQRIQQLEQQLQQVTQRMNEQTQQIALLQPQQNQQNQQRPIADPAYNIQNLNTDKLLAAANLQVCNPRLSHATRLKMFDATQLATTAIENQQRNNVFVKHKLAEALGETIAGRNYGAYLDQVFKCQTLGMPLPSAPPAQAPSDSRSSSRRQRKPKHKKQ